jgi:F0F1-type ATP synthase membrane subunit a
MVFAYKQQFLIAVVVGSVIWFICFTWMKLPLSSTTGKLINGCVQVLFVVAWIQMFFGIFESLIQSFVIAMLSMTYLALSVKHDRLRDRKGIAWN